MGGHVGVAGRYFGSVDAMDQDELMGYESRNG